MDMVAGPAMQSWHASDDACSAVGKRWKECLIDVMADGEVPRDASCLRVEMMCSRLCSMLYALLSRLSCVCQTVVARVSGASSNNHHHTVYGTPLPDRYRFPEIW